MYNLYKLFSSLLVYPLDRGGYRLVYPCLGLLGAISHRQEGVASRGPRVRYASPCQWLFPSVSLD